jgi:hypothetical protein
MQWGHPLGRLRPSRSVNAQFLVHQSMTRKPLCSLDYRAAEMSIELSGPLLPNPQT